MPYNERTPNEDRVDQVLKWLDLPPADRPRFLTLYFNDVDSAGHWYGPDSSQVVAAVERLDAMIGRLVRGLEQRGIVNDVNIVLTSDHGMVETSRRRIIVVDDLVPSADGVDRRSRSDDRRLAAAGTGGRGAAAARLRAPAPQGRTGGARRRPTGTFVNIRGFRRSSASPTKAGRSCGAIG